MCCSSKATDYTLLAVVCSHHWLSKLILSELTVPIDRTCLWSDSTVVLTWLYSESCSYKAFVANRIVEILELTTVSEWRYVDTKQNPADNITRGKPLKDLTSIHRWHIPSPSFQSVTCTSGSCQADYHRVEETPFLWPHTAHYAILPARSKEVQ